MANRISCLKNSSLLNEELIEQLPLDNFEIENGLIGLERDIFLVLLKFLNEQNIRNVI
jgi:hypothetical protein